MKLQVPEGKKKKENTLELFYLSLIHHTVLKYYKHYIIVLIGISSHGNRFVFRKQLLDAVYI